MHKENHGQLSLFDFLDDDVELKEDFSTKIAYNPSWSKYKARKSFPTELIIDFKRFIDYLNQHPIQLTKKMGYISRKHLPSINEQLSIKTKSVTDYSQQEYYPYIHLFYYIALAGGLIRKVDVDSSQPRLEITDRWSVYKHFTDTEKYFILLETFWVDVDWAEIINKLDNPIIFLIEEVFTTLLSNSHLQLKGTLLQSLTSHWGYFFLYLEWFGLWVCEPDLEEMEKRNRKNQYLVSSVSLTDFAKKMIPILINKRHPQYWNIPFRSETGEINPIPGTALPELTEAEYDNQASYNKDHSVQPFYKAFTDLFSPLTLRKSIPRKERRYTPGYYTFKIAYSSSSWCKVILGAEHTMADLHNIILQTFQFDDDHLYSFFLDGKKWSKKCIVSPYDNSGSPIASEVKVASVGLYAGIQFMYLYDYGDEWTFTITVEKIEEKEPEHVIPYLIERKGYGPEQYFYY